MDSDEERGYIRLTMEGELSRESDILLRSLAMGLSDLEADEANQDYVDIIFEEV